MKRAEVILNLAREITELQEKKRVLDAEIKSVNEKLRDRMGRFSQLVPNGEEAFDEAELDTPQSSTPGSTRRTLADAILDVMKQAPDRVFVAEDLVRMVPDSKIDTVRSTLARMFTQGLVLRVGKGQYRVAAPSTKPDPQTPLLALNDQESSGGR